MPPLRYLPGPGPCGKALTLTIKQRRLLHCLLHRDLRKCSTSSLEACRRWGWISGAGSGYELTTPGRNLAELSEQAPADRSLVLDRS